jgi:hypothetical protein
MSLRRASLFRLQLSFLALMCSAVITAATVHYVDLNNASPVSPFTDWSTAATNIQDAIDAAVDGDLVLVTNGVYATGGRVVYGSLTNRVVVNKALTLQSVNGPADTIIQGYAMPSGGIGNSAIRCVYLTNNALLIGFMLTNGATRGSGDSTTEQSGGGVWCESNSCIVSNCIVTFNRSWVHGGGVYRGTVNRSLLTLNIVAFSGAGAADSSVLNDCTIASNFATSGAGGVVNATCNGCLVISNTAGFSSGGGGGGGGPGGASGGILKNCTFVGNHGTEGGVGRNASGYNCIIYYNDGSLVPSQMNISGGQFNFCCTTPAPVSPGSSMNFSTPPAFVNPSAGDFHLQSTSPCINSGRNGFASGSTDLDGNPRIVGLSVDVGLYEFQAPTSVLSYNWAQGYGYPVDGSADFLDPDGDGLNNWQEWMAGTSPTSAASVLKIVSIKKDPTGLRVSWQAGFSIMPYFLERSTNLAARPAFTEIKTNIFDFLFTDTTATNGGPYYYRVGVR